MGDLGAKVASACKEFYDDDKWCIGLMFLRVLVPAHLGCPALKAIKWWLLLFRFWHRHITLLDSQHATCDMGTHSTV